MRRRFAALVLAMVLVAGLAACTDGQASSASVLPQSTAPVSTPSASQPADDPPPIPVPVESDRAFLTGLRKGADYPRDKRITAVMVNNIASSRPTSGLSDAEILVEIVVEGGITRFMALYDDYTTLPKVGSVRSARDQFFQLLLPFWGFYVHDGPHQDTHPLNIMLDDYQYHEFDLQQSKGATFFTDRPGYVQEHTEYTDAAHVMSAVEESSASDYRSYGSPIFDFVPYDEPARVPSSVPMAEVAVVHSENYRTFFEYDAEAGKYKMSMYNEITGALEPTVDENNGERLAFENLLVLFAPMELYADSDLVRVDYGVGGGGYYFTQGRFEPLVWRKGAPNEPLLLYAAGKDNAITDQMVKINTGKTYLAVVDLDKQMNAFNYSLMDNTARQVAEAGGVNPNPQETTD